MKLLTLMFLVVSSPALAHTPCLVSFDTSQGKDTFTLDATQIQMVMKSHREDRSLNPLSCIWFVCSYPKIENSAIVLKDMTLYHVRDSYEVAQNKVKTCRKN